MLTHTFKSILAAATILTAVPAVAVAQTTPSPSAVSEQQRLTVGDIRPFTISVDQSILDRITQRVADANLPRPLGADGWETGASIAWLEEMRSHWLENYNWRETEERLNKLPQFMIEVGEFDLHYIKVEGKGPNPEPLLLVHGWPYSNFTFEGLIDRLTDPAKYGGRAEDALTVVAPAIPGYGFSTTPNRAVGPAETAAVFTTLMRDGLGYERFGVHGGDHGGTIAVYVADAYPDLVSGLHLHLIPTNFPTDPSADELAWAEAGQAFQAQEFDYFRLQANRPQMPAVALNDSPMGTAAWIWEKFWAWTDHDGDLTSVIGRSQLIDEVMVYLVTDSIETSLWHYRGIRDEVGFAFHPGGQISVPTGVIRFPEEFIIARPPRSLIEDNYNLRSVTDVSAGGHFPMLTQESVLADHILSFFANPPAHRENTNGELK